MSLYPYRLSVNLSLYTLESIASFIVVYPFLFSSYSSFVREAIVFYVSWLRSSAGKRYLSAKVQNEVLK